MASSHTTTDQHDIRKRPHRHDVGDHTSEPGQS
jgi:hypothetical protein